MPKRKCLDSATALHREYSKSLNTLNIQIFIYKQRGDLLPCVSNQFYKINSKVRLRNSRQDANLFIPTNKNRIRENSLKLTGARL